MQIGSILPSFTLSQIPQFMHGLVSKSVSIPEAMESYRLLENLSSPFQTSHSLLIPDVVGTQLMGPLAKASAISPQLATIVIPDLADAYSMALIAGGMIAIGYSVIQMGRYVKNLGALYLLNKFQDKLPSPKDQLFSELYQRYFLKHPEAFTKVLNAVVSKLTEKMSEIEQRNDRLNTIATELGVKELAYTENGTAYNDLRAQVQGDIEILKSTISQNIENQNNLSGLKTELESLRKKLLARIAIRSSLETAEVELNKSREEQRALGVEIRKQASVTKEETEAIESLIRRSWTLVDTYQRGQADFEAGTAGQEDMVDEISKRLSQQSTRALEGSVGRQG